MGINTEVAKDEMILDGWRQISDVVLSGSYVRRRRHEVAAMSKTKVWETHLGRLKAVHVLDSTESSRLAAAQSGRGRIFLR